MNKKIQKLKLLRKRKVWPTVVAFLVFMVLCVSMMGLFVQFFAQYILSAKISRMSEETQGAVEMLNNSMTWGRSLTQAAAEVDAYMGKDSAIYIVDRERRVLAKTGDSEPDFDMVAEVTLNENYVFVGDSEWDDGVNTLFGVPVSELMQSVFGMGSGGPEVQNEAWLQQPVVSQRFWMWEPFSYNDQEYLLFVRCVLEIQRQDVFYVLIFGIFTLLMLMLPMCFLLVNMIKSVVMQGRMTQMLYLDDVTGQNNWLYFKNTASRILATPRARRKNYALVCLHLERYKNFCACYGVKEGEALLADTAGFLVARVGRDEVVARNESADFAMLIGVGGEDEEAAREICRKRLRSLLAEMTGLRPEQKIHFHAGAYLIPADPILGRKRWRSQRSGLDIDQMYNYANAAQMSTKCQEEHRIGFFDKELLEKQLWERKVEDTMDLALKNEEFQVYLQPKYSPTEAKLVGAEALVRWISPQDGFISPGKFIPIFEENGFITQLDDYMISHVAKLQAEWKIRGKKAVPVSVNVSRAHFAQEGLAEHICQLVDAYGPPHELIELEVTESAFFDDKDVLVETVKQLKDYGFRVSMDDFGAGYSSLNSLKDIPLDVLKLDGEFFRGEDDDGRGAIVVREAIQLARSLNMRVVAEGVEKKEQVDFLAGQGCDMIQGFYFAKPMPVKEFEDKVEKDA